MKYYRVTGGVNYTKSCGCPNCDGHSTTAGIDQVVESPDNARKYVDSYALIAAGIPVDAEWEYGPTIADVTLETLERKTLAEWNAGKPTASPLALAMPRGEL
jgi:deoxycytidylate deaminase